MMYILMSNMLLESLHDVFIDSLERQWFITMNMSSSDKDYHHSYIYHYNRPNEQVIRLSASVVCHTKLAIGKFIWSTSIIFNLYNSGVIPDSALLVQCLCVAGDNVGNDKKRRNTKCDKTSNVSGFVYGFIVMLNWEGVQQNAAFFKFLCFFPFTSQCF